MPSFPSEAERAVLAAYYGSLRWGRMDCDERMVDGMSISTKKGLHDRVGVGALIGILGKIRGCVTDTERVAVARARVALLVCPIITFYLFDLYTHNPLVDMKPKVQVLNIVFYELMAVMLTGLFGRIRAALMVQSGFFMAAGLANYYVLKFRSAPIMPWDIFSLSTAASVADNFDYTPEKDTVLVLIGFVILLVLESRMKVSVGKKLTQAASGAHHLCSEQKCAGQAEGSVKVITGKRLVMRLLMIAVPAVLLYGYIGMVQNDSFILEFGLYDKLFTPTVINKRDGNIVAFLMEMEYLSVEKPEGYSAQDAGKLLDTYGSEELDAALADPGSVDRPNIIVIMDEAFSDLAVLGEFQTNEDYMPFIHSLQQDEDVVSGNLNVSVLGGNTANTEFEFLTGHTMAFLPQGSVAYQQYLKNDEASLPAYLKTLGYSTVAIHPYYADGWERDTVYPMLGFDEFLSKDDFKGAKKIRKYISDEACFDRIIELYENKEEGEPLFIFNVTMQNHSGYDEVFANFTPDIEVDGINSKVLNQYLSLMKKTDEAFEELIAYFSEQEEDTMIVFFGDHQPTTYVSNFIVRSNGLQPDSLSLEENLLKYKTPYIIWSNFEMSGTTTGGETSANYLAIDVLENCGLPLTQYQNYLKELREDYPIISAQQIRDAQGNLCTDEGSEEKQEKDAEAVLPYQSLQYYLLFDCSSSDSRHRAVKIALQCDFARLACAKMRF